MFWSKKSIEKKDPAYHIEQARHNLKKAANPSLFSVVRNVHNTPYHLNKAGENMVDAYEAVASDFNKNVYSEDFNGNKKPLISTGTLAIFAGVIIALTYVGAISLFTLLAITCVTSWAYSNLNNNSSPAEFLR